MRFIHLRYSILLKVGAVRAGVQPAKAVRQSCYRSAIAAQRCTITNGSA